MTPTDTTGFVMEKMRKMVSCVIAAAWEGLCFPSASNTPLWPRRATMIVAPGMVPLSISRRNTSDMRCSAGAKSPSYGLSRWNDPIGGVTLDSERHIDVLSAVKGAAEFVRLQIGP